MSTKPSPSWRQVALALDRRGQILAADREGRAIWREHAGALAAVAERAFGAGERGGPVSDEVGGMLVVATAGHSGRGTPVVLLVLRRVGPDPWSAQGALETEKYQALGRLVSGMVHEMRNPLASISITAELLALRPDVPAEVKERLQDVVHHVERAEEVLQSMRRFGRETQAAMRLVSLNELVDDAVRLERSSVIARSARIRVELDPEVPAVLADSSQLRLVVSNLIRNAAEAIEAAGRTDGEIVVRTSHRHGVVRLVVEDDGPGVPAEHLGRIFEPHFTTKAKGTGLGLAMCASIVRAHGGHIWAENRRQHGARFLVDVPDPQHSTPVVQPTALGIELTAQPACSALIVDPDEDRLEDTRKAVAAIGFRVHVAGDAAVALRKLRAADFDAVIVTPRGDAAAWLEFCRSARLAHPEVTNRLAVLLAETTAGEIAEGFRRAGVRVVVAAHEAGTLQALVRALADAAGRGQPAGVAAG